MKNITILLARPCTIRKQMLQINKCLVIAQHPRYPLQKKKKEKKKSPFVSSPNRHNFA